MKNLYFLIIFAILIVGCKKSKDGTVEVIPLTPSNLTGEVASTTQINLQWVDRSTNETGFKIERKTGSGTFVVIGTNVTDVTTFNDTGLTPSTTYTYRVYSYNAVGNSLTYSNELTLTTRSIITLPTLTTTTVSSITYTTSVSGGTISSDGGASITERGVCWSTSPNPTISLSTKTTNGTGTGLFNSNITGLTPNTTYHVRAYATNSVGTAYGNELIFNTTPLTLPTLITTSVSSISALKAISGGTVSNDGGASITARGVVWSTSPNPTITLLTKTSSGTGIGTFISNLVSLSLNVTYYIRSYATNSVGTAYGNEISFTTKYAVGDIGPAGGFIFYDKGVSSNGWRYLEASPNDYPTAIAWWNGKWTNTNTTGISPNTSLGAGKANTLLIISANNNLINAAKVCDDYSYNGFSDWYLPSSEELQLICQNLFSAGIGNLQFDAYWSSTDTNRIHNAIHIQMQGCYVRTDGGRDYMKMLVRPVRQF